MLPSNRCLDQAPCRFLPVLPLTLPPTVSRYLAESRVASLFVAPNSLICNLLFILAPARGAYIYLTKELQNCCSRLLLYQLFYPCHLCHVMVHSTKPNDVTSIVRVATSF